MCIEQSKLNLDPDESQLFSILTSLAFQTGFSGNFIVLTVFFCGGLMMNEAALTMGELSAFLLYATYAGMSIGGALAVSGCFTSFCVT